jgi:protein-S-isoprenylcysteine O-methyltransferase Ste14
MIAACWIIFLVYWIVSGRSVKAAAERKGFPSALAYRVPNLLGIALFFLSHRTSPLNLAVIPRSELTLILGDVVCGLGLVLAVWSRLTLGGNWSSDVTFKEDHQLIQTGPYRFARHPIYTGILTMLLGTAIYRGILGCWLGLLSVTFGFWIKLKQEERLLVPHFPDSYPAYKLRVKALVPFMI